MALTATFVDKVKATGTASGDKYADGGGMYLLVKPIGKYWRMDYRFEGKRKTLALGVYKDVSLAKARERRDEARQLLADGVDPGQAKRDGKHAKTADHLVPLSTQAVALLRGVEVMSGGGKYVFPSIRTADRCMSENTVNAALRCMGYTKDVMTAHGFRAMARTILDEVLGERVDLIEHQLAHAVKDPKAALITERLPYPRAGR